MNLHGLAAGIIGAVNPPVLATIQSSTGYTTAPSGKRTPTFRTATGMVQVQDLANKDIQHLNGMNIQGVTKKAYCYGQVNSIIRASRQGGDILTLPDGTKWLVRLSFESWPEWCAVGLVQQVP